MNKFTKLFVVVLTLALLVGAVVGVTAYAEGETTEGTYEEKDLIISYNVSYADYMHLYLAIDTTLAADYTCITADVTVNGQTYEGISIAQEDADTTLYGTVTGHVLRTPGVAAKDMLDDITVTVYYSKTTTEGEGEEAVTTTVNYTDTVTYSVAQYFFERLYKNGIVDATAGTDLSRKQLYVAALNYGAAAQNLLATDDTKFISDLIYVWGDVNLGMVEKGDYELALGTNLYDFTYYNIDSATGTSDVASGSGYFTFDKSVYVEAIDIATSNAGPEGAVNFEGLTASENNLITAANKDLAVGSGNGGISSVTVNSQATSLGFANIVSNGAGNYLRLEKNGWKSGNQQWVNFNTNASAFAEGDTAFVFQTRVRFYQSTVLYEEQTSTSSGNFRFRFYWNGTGTSNRLDNYIGALDGAKVKINLAADSSSGAYTSEVNSGEWFTLRYVITAYDATNNPNNLKAYIMNEETGEFTMVKEAAFKVATDVSLIQNVRLMESTDLKGYADFDYVYSDFVADAENISITLPDNIESIAEVTRTPDYTKEAFANGQTLEAGIVTSDKTTVYNSCSHTVSDNMFAAVITQNGETFLRSYKTSAVTSQASVQFNKASDEGSGNVVVFETDMRVTVPDGYTNKHGTSYAYQLRVMEGTTRHSNAYLETSTSDSKVYIGNTASTVDLGEWFTFRVTYTYTAADETAGTDASATIKITVIDSDGTETNFDVAYEGSVVSADAITAFRLTSTQACSMIVDFKDANFTVSNSASDAE